jgi:hypothetical protein
MVNKGNRLNVGEDLVAEDYLVSENGLFYAIMQLDGNLCVYRGSGPENSYGGLWCSGTPGYGDMRYYLRMENSGKICIYRPKDPMDPDCDTPQWCSGKRGDTDNYFAYLENDGNICVYKQRDTGNINTWCNGKTDPIKDIAINSIDYDVQNGKIIQSAPTDLAQQNLKNDTEIEQSAMVELNESVTEISGWSDTLGIKVGVSTTFQTGIPIIANGKITVSVEVSNSYTWNGSTSKTKAWKYSVPSKIPPKTEISCLFSVTVSTLSVPYTLKGTAILKSGAKVPIKVNGFYTGKNSHDLEVKWVSKDFITGEIISKVEKIGDMDISEIISKDPKIANID